MSCRCSLCFFKHTNTTCSFSPLIALRTISSVCSARWHTLESVPFYLLGKYWMFRTLGIFFHLNSWNYSSTVDLNFWVLFFLLWLIFPFLIISMILMFLSSILKEWICLINFIAVSYEAWNSHAIHGTHFSTMCTHIYGRPVFLL